MGLEKYLNWGIIKVKGNDVQLWYSQSSYDTINCQTPVTDARWGGHVVVVTLINGKIRRYHSRTQYTSSL